ncbi:MAG: tetratricopeptide repeat protein [Vicinamibacterales bacterium]
MKLPKNLFTLVSCLALGAAFAVGAAGQVPTTGAGDAVADARKLTAAGKVGEAIEAFRRAIEANPDRWDAHYGLGVALDLDGAYEEARKHLQKAVELAPEASRQQALTGMAVSYAFESKPDEAARYYKQIYDERVGAKTYWTAGEAANALGRIYLESGDTDKALEWYRKGYEAAKQQPELKPEQMDLAEMRWHNAQARIDARRGQADSARKHVGEARKLMEKGTNPDQAEFMPYLEGYVALHTGRPEDAVAQLQKGNMNDPFVLMLLGQACEKQGNDAKAQEYYRKILAMYGHNINNAFARPVAKSKARSG